MFAKVLRGLKDGQVSMQHGEQGLLSLSCVLVPFQGDGDLVQIAALHEMDCATSAVGGIVEGLHGLMVAEFWLAGNWDNGYPISYVENVSNMNKPRLSFFVIVLQFIRLSIPWAKDMMTKTGEWQQV